MAGETGWKNQKEVAQLIVEGQIFRDWTSVTVETYHRDPFSKFQFDSTEFGEMSASFRSMLDITANKIKPGTRCQIILAGHKVIDGYVIERHVAYDARQHAIRISGVSKTFDLTDTSHIPKSSGSYDKKNFVQIAQIILEPYGIQLEEKGAVDKTPYKNVHIQQGELAWAILERLARHRKIVLGSTPLGNLLAIGDHDAKATDKLVEGVNILRANCVIRDEYAYKKIYGQGQDVSSDESWGDPQNKQRVSVDGSSKRYRPLMVVNDIPDTTEGLRKRVEFERNTLEGMEIEAHITVQGWVKSGGDLWKAGEYYWVKSPMLILDRNLGCRKCVYQQNASGTTTTLEMVPEFFMNGRPNMSGPAPT